MCKTEKLKIFVLAIKYFSIRLSTILLYTKNLIVYREHLYKYNVDYFYTIATRGAAKLTCIVEVIRQMKSSRRLMKRNLFMKV